MSPRAIEDLFGLFIATYSVDEMNAVWQSQSQRFRDFWNRRIMTPSSDEVNDSEIDEIVRILDRTGKGNTAASEVVARTMIPQGAWRRIFKQMRDEPLLAATLSEVFGRSDLDGLTAAIDEVYRINQGRKNNLTGQSGHAVAALLAAYDPFKNLSMISLNHRRRVIECFAVAGDPDFDRDSVGKKLALSNVAILDGFATLGVVNQNSRTLSRFLYSPSVASLWKRDDPEPPPEPPTPEPDDISLFHIEKQLEDFLIANWDKTEPGQHDGELVSQQYRTGIGVIDILARDKATKQLVVIELKRNQTSDDTIGQLTRYMGWLEEHQPTGKPTKGIIIAAQYDQRLNYAPKKVRDVEVYLYRGDFKLKEFKGAWQVSSIF